MPMPIQTPDLSRQPATPAINLQDSLPDHLHAQSLDGLDKVTDRHGHRMMAADSYSASFPDTEDGEDLDDDFDDEIDYEL